jgi:hypothetical protein
MRARDAIGLSLKALKEKPLESGLIVLGIALSGCVAAASLLLLGSQSAKMEKVLSGPGYREIIVRPAQNLDQNDSQPVREASAGQDPNRQRMNFGDADITAVKAAVASVTAGYFMSNENLRVGAFGGPGGGGNFFFGGQQGAQAVSGQAANGQAATGQAATGQSTTGQAASAQATNGPAGDPQTASAQASSDQGASGQAATGQTGRTRRSAASGQATGAQTATAESGATAIVVAPDGGPPGDFGGPPGDFFNQQQEQVDESSLLTIKETEIQALEISPAFFDAYGVQAEFGSLFNDTDAQNRAATVVIGPALAKRLFPEMEPSSLVGKKARLAGRVWTISGILGEGSDAVTISSGTKLSELAFTPVVQFTIRNGNQTIQIGRGQNRIRFSVASSKDLKDATDGIQAYFDTTYGEGRVSLTVPYKTAQLSRNSFERLLWLIVAFGVGGFFMAMINLMNMMLTRAMRRQQPLGILSAIGAARADIASLQASEGGILALAGMVVGIVLSIPLYNLLYKAGEYLFELGTGAIGIDPAIFAGVSAGLLALSLLLALLPAMQTSRVSIVTALKNE